MEEKYKVGYYDEKGNRRYKIVDSKETALQLIESLLDSPGQVSVKKVSEFKL